MTRAVPIWVGATPDTPIPPRIRVRVFERFGGRCQCGCGVLIRPGDKWEADHIVALANGGSNSEDNLQPLIVAHHKKKTKADVAEKSKVAKKKARHLGVRQKSRFACSKDSKWKKRIDGTVVER